MLDQDLIEELEDELKSPSKDRRKAALLSLIRIGSGSNVHEDVLHLAQEDPDPEIRYIARKALNQINLNHRPEFDEARGLIQKLLQNTGEKRNEVYRRVFSTEDSFMKIELLRTLVTDEEALSQRELLTEILRNLIREERDKSLVPTYIRALGTFGGPAELPLLQKFLQSRNPRVVANTIEALEELGEESAQNMVLPLLAHEDNRVRANAIRLIHRFDPKRAQQEIQNISLSEHPWMRASSLYCLRVLEVDGAMDIAAAMVERETDPDLLTTLLEFITTNGEPSCAYALTKRLGSEDDANLKSSLQEALSTLCLKLNLDSHDLQQTVLDQEIERKQEEKRELQRKSESNREKESTPVPSKKSVYKPLVILVGSIGLSLLILRLGWETGVVRKSYSIDPLSRKEALSSELQLKYLKAEFLRGRGQYQEALLEYETLLSYSGSHFQSLRGKGICLVFLGNLDPARLILEKVLKKRPRDALSAKALSRIYLLQKEDPELVVSMLEKSIRLDPLDLLLPQTLAAYQDFLKQANN